jgi:hypothetical protein
MKTLLIVLALAGLAVLFAGKFGGMGNPHP